MIHSTIRQVDSSNLFKRILNLMTSALADLRYAIRTLRNSPGVTSLALLSLALGIGANTAIFSLIDSVLLKSLPVRNPKELRIVNIINQRGQQDSFSYPLYERVRDSNRVFSGVFAASSRITITELIGPLLSTRLENTRVQLVTGEYFDVLGVNAFAGRLITPADNSPGSPNPVAVVSHRFWREKFGQDYSVVGKSIKLNGETLTITGISAPGFFGDSVGEAPDFWAPVALQQMLDRGFSKLGRANYGWLRMMGRLRPGLSESQARAAMGVLLAQTKSENDSVANLMRQENVARFDLEPGDKGVSSLRVRFSQPLRIVMAIVALLLLIACANVANLLLARSSARQTEIAIRLAVGASRWRIARQMLTESILLASMGGILGILVAYWGGLIILNLVSTGQTPVALDLKFDTRVLGFTIATCLTTGLLFGLLPTLLAIGQDVNSAQKVKTPPSTRTAVFRPLVVTQIAISVLLLTGASLFVGTLSNLRSLDLGFKLDHIIQVRVSPAVSGYKREQLPTLHARLLARLSSVPGVLSVGMADQGFQDGSSSICCITVEGYIPRPLEDRRVQTLSVTQEYFATMGVTLLAGRGFLPRDVSNPRDLASAKSTIVNEAFARYYFGNLNAVGKRTAWSNPPNVKYTTEIIGIAKDSVWGDLRKGARPMMYFLSEGGDVIEVRTGTDPAAMISAVRSSIRTEDQNLRILTIETIPHLREQALAQEKLIANLASFFGALALLLAGVGVYGMMSYGVVRRRHEIGIRMALGAQRADVLWMVLREVPLLVAIGSAIGISAAVAGERFIASQLFGIEVADPLLLAAVPAVLLVVAGVGAYVPARRASHVHPLVALRYE